MGLRICMFVYNPFRPDVRVLKEARSLMAAGHRVTVIAVQDANSLPEENFEGVRVVRWARNPLHHRVVRVWRRVIKGADSRRRGGMRALLSPSPLLGRIIRKLRRKKGAPLHRRAWRRLSKYRVIGGPIRRAQWYVVDPVLRLLPQRPPKEQAPDPVKPPADSEPTTDLTQVEATDVASKRGGDGSRGEPASGARPPNAGAQHGRFQKSNNGQELPPRLRRTISNAAARLFSPVRPLLHAAKAYVHWNCCFRDFERGAERIIGHDRYDVFHAHDLNTLPVARRVARKRVARLVYDSHELYAEVSGHSPIEKKFWMRLERRLIHECDAVITVCESIAEELQKRYAVPRPRVLLNAPPPEAADDGRDLFREKLGIPVDVPVVLYQGGYSPNRGLENLVTAAAKFERGVLVMMGWGKIEQHLRDLARSLGLGQRVLFVPAVAQDVLLSWTGSADVGVIPYRFVGLNNYYSCPNKLFEYINAGVAIAGSAFPEISRFINAHGLGVTFNPDDPDDIARAVNEILADPQRHRQMRQNARDARQVLNWDHEAKKLLEVYSSLKGAEPQVRQNPAGGHYRTAGASTR